MPFTQKVEAHILSDDKFARDFALQTIHSSHLGTERTFLLALEALDKLPINRMVNSIIPNTRNLPVTEAVLQELLKRLERKDGNLIWYATILEQCDTALIAKYENQLSPFVNEYTMQKILHLLPMDSEQLFMEAGGVMNELENEFNGSLYRYGKRIFQELIKHGEYNEANFWDIEAGIKQDYHDDYFSYNGIYNVYLAGEQRVASLIPILSSLLVRVEEDLLLQEVSTALIKIGTEEVIETVEKYIQTIETSFAAIDISENIKLPSAEEALLRQFELAQDPTIKTMIANALCKQLSTIAIPKVEALIEEGYDEEMLDLKKPLYANCVINEINHPKLEQWQQLLIKKGQYWEEQKKEQIRQQAQNVKVGRNDPCLCGSGKKFKKCCGR